MATYEPISMSEAVKLPKTYMQAAHAFLYAKQEGKFLGKYDKKYAVMVKWVEDRVRAIMTPYLWDKHNYFFSPDADEVRWYAWFPRWSGRCG